MKKIIINLHPVRESENENKALMLISKYIPFIVIAVGALICINILFFTLAASSQISQKKLAKKWESLTPQREKTTVLKEEFEALNREKIEYQQLFINNIRFSKILADLFEAIPKNIWIQAIKFNDNQLRFTGYAVEWKGEKSLSPDAFVKELSKKKYLSGIFKNINLINYRSAQISGVNVIEFRIECKK